MSIKTITRAQLSEAVYQEVGLSRSESAHLLESVLSHISETLTKEGTVKISSFGSFSVRQKGQRIGRNPKTGDEVQVSAKRLPVWRTGTELRQRVDSGFSTTE